MKKYIYQFSIFLISLFLHLNCDAEIIKIDNFKDLREIILSQADKNTLVLFDIDDVILWMTDDFCLSTPERLPLYDKLVSRYSKREIHLIFSDYFKKSQVVLIDEGIRNLLKILKNKNISTSALTGMWTGQYGTIKDMYKTSFRHLKQVNISFDATTPFSTEKSFPSLVEAIDDPNEEGKVPMIKSGIIFSARGDKGKVLEHVYKIEHLHYSNIIFIDDMKKNIDRVIKACERLQIKCVGILYRAKDLRKKPRNNIEQEKKGLGYLKKNIFGF